MSDVKAELAAASASVTSKSLATRLKEMFPNKAPTDADYFDTIIAAVKLAAIQRVDNDERATSLNDAGLLLDGKRWSRYDVTNFARQLGIRLFPLNHAQYEPLSKPPHKSPSPSLSISARPKPYGYTSP